MKILFVASEMTPFCKTGGLADVIGTLPVVLARMGNEVAVMLPGYSAIDRQKYGFDENRGRFQVTVGPVTKPATVSSASWKGITIHLIENEEYFDRPGLYGEQQGDYYDNGPRFVFFSRGALEAARLLGIKPDIIHAHDWQTGLILPYLRTLYAWEPLFYGASSLFTIHNLGYQGIFPPWVFSLTGIPDEEFRWTKMEFYGNVSFLKSGIVYADAVSTVSETYAREITTEPLGFGMQGVLTERKNDLFGILNGIDQEEWNPATDQSLPARYTSAEMSGKKICRQALLKEFGISPGEDSPVFGMVSRLDSQKGFDILEEGVKKIASMAVCLVILGTGTREHAVAMEKLAAEYPDRIRIMVKFDPLMARLVYAGSDAFLMPSRYEPCGLGQFIALRYGTLPVVHATGGLADTVHDLDSDPDYGNGFSFEEYTSEALVEAMERAVKAFTQPGRKRWLKAVGRAMSHDYSWKRSAEKYEKLYQQIRNQKG
ncbi:MAG: glycogen synthase GlgA [Candidatus Latescibacter sp.]|nr:glycogen synthase GlgA [Candidatus Latescibacter sp.]